MFDRILYAAELGDGQPRSLTLVKELALAHDSEVIVLRVGELTAEQLALAKKHEADLEKATAEAEIQARIEGQLASVDVAEALTQAGVFARSITRSGRIAEEVLIAADEVDAELIIVGSAPRTVLGALLTGNVTDEIVRKARRPVLVVPSEGKAPSDEPETAASE